MRGWLRLRGWALLIGAFILGAVGIIYAVEIQRGIGASAVVGEVQTVEDTILVWNQIDPNQQPLIDLEFGTADVNAFGLFKAISTVPVFVENGGDVSFELRVQATDVKINGSAVGDVLALAGCG